MEACEKFDPDPEPHESDADPKPCILFIYAARTTHLLAELYCSELGSLEI
jgi:hypothetical protein